MRVRYKDIGLSRQGLFCAKEVTLQPERTSKVQITVQVFSKQVLVET